MAPALRPVWRRVWARVENRAAATDARFAPVEARLAELDARSAPVSARLGSGEARMEAAEARLGSADARLGSGEARLAAAEARLEPLEARLAVLEGAWRQHVPSFLNAVGTVAAFGHEVARLRRDATSQAERVGAALEEGRRAAEHSLGEAARLRDQVEARLAGLPDGAAVATRLDNADASIRSLWERVEFVRREIMFEIQHGQGGGPPEAVAADGARRVEPRVVAAEKVAEARAAGSLRLNLGCGHIALPDYVNVDMRELPGVDVVAEAGDLPFEPGSVDEIFSAHLLEHFPQEAVRRRLLPYWRGLLRPGGAFRAVTPDAAAMLSAAGEGAYPFEDFREVVFGAQDYAGDFHYNLFTPDSLGGLLRETGFGEVEVPVAGRRNGKCFEFEISARRSA